MILTKKEILKEIKKKRVRVSPFNPRAIGPASIDLTLDKYLRVFKDLKKSVPVRSSIDYKSITRKKIIKGKFTLKPGELVLGITKEKIKLPEDICGWLSSRSRFARLGIMIHITAPFIQPGVNNKQVLEIFNASTHELDLVAGEKLCQLVLQRCEGNAKYTGKFKNQKL